jgi:RNA polymerase sigma factor (sigma-70 family)
MTHRKHMPHGTFVGAHPQVKQLWFKRDIEPELLSGEPIPDLPDESDPLRERDAKVLVNILLERCKPQEVRVLTMRYMEEMTLEEVGQVLGVTRERIRQIENKAIRRIRWRAVSDKDVGSFFS